MKLFCGRQFLKPLHIRLILQPTIVSRVRAIGSMGWIGSSFGESAGKYDSNSFDYYLLPTPQQMTIINTPPTLKRKKRQNPTLHLFHEIEVYILCIFMILFVAQMEKHSLLIP